MFLGNSLRPFEVGELPDSITLSIAFSQRNEVTGKRMLFGGFSIFAVKAVALKPIRL